MALTDIEWGEELQVPALYVEPSSVEVFHRKDKSSELDDVAGQPCRARHVYQERRATDYHLIYDDRGHVLFEVREHDGVPSAVRRITRGPRGSVVADLAHLEDKWVGGYACLDRHGMFIGTWDVSKVSGRPFRPLYRYEYDARVRPVRVYVLRGSEPELRAELRWSERNELIEERFHHETGDSWTVEYIWKAGRPVSAFVDGQVTRTWTYGKGDNVEVVDRAKNGSVVVRRRYRGATKLEEIQNDPRSGEARSLYRAELDARGRLIAVYEPRETTRIAYDQHDRQISKDVHDTGDLLSQWTYAYDNCRSRDKVRRLFGTPPSE